MMHFLAKLMSGIYQDIKKLSQAQSININRTKKEY